jgi:hypothetical protein
MGPATSTPAFALLLLACLIGGASLWAMGFPQTGGTAAGIGAALLLLHRASVYGYRRAAREDLNRSKLR